MVKVLRIFTYMVFFILALIYFIPKSSVYYYVEKELELYNIILSQEEIVQNNFSLDINNAQVTYQKIDSAEIENIDVKIFLVYNSIDLVNVKLSSMASAFIPTKIDILNLKYSVINPLHIEVEASGEFGDVKGEIDVVDRNLSMILSPSELMLKKYKNSLKLFKKNEQGEYEYDKTF